MNPIPLLLLLAGQASAGQPDAVAAFHCSGHPSIDRVSVQAVQAAYDWRSIAIIKAGLAGDVSLLGSMVAPSVTFAIWRGDAGWGARSTGPAATVEFARRLNPKTFQFSNAISGPIATHPCGEATAELMLKGDASGEAAILTFKYRDGILIAVDGREVELVNGVFGAAYSK
ncbi:MAG: hypothetical protein ABIS51_11320 [Sphingomonas sp.]